MPARRVVPPPPLPAGTKARGPASYFPSIEKTYGRPIQHWLDVWGHDVRHDWPWWLKAMPMYADRLF